MKAAIPTIKKILEDGGSVILMSHWAGRKMAQQKSIHLNIWLIIIRFVE